MSQGLINEANGLEKMHFSLIGFRLKMDVQRKE